MTWGRQVLHVMAKDLRQQWWLVAGYVLAVLGITARAAGWIGEPAARPDFVVSVTRFVPVLPALAILLAALVIQSDSPTRSDAFWATRPLAPSAVLAAKLLTLGVVLWAVPMLGQLAALRALGVGSDKLGDLLRNTGILQGGLILALALIAALTRDLRTFLVGLIGASIAWSAADVYSTFRILPIVIVGYAASNTLRAGVWLVTGLLGLGYVYRTRNVGRALALTVVVALSGLLFARGAQRTGAIAPNGVEPIPTSVDGGALSVDPVGLQPLNGSGSETWWSLHVRVSLPDQPVGYRFQLLQARAELTLPDGSIAHPSGAQVVQLLTSPGPVADGYRWLREQRDGEANHPSGGVLSFTLREPEARAIEQGGASLRLTGLIEVAEPRPLGSMPLVEGARLRKNDTSYRITTLRSLGAVVQVGLVREAVGEAFRSFSTPYEEPSAALVNRQRGEGLLLHTGGRGNGYRPLVLSGAQVATTSYDLSSDRRVPPGSSADGPDVAWLEGAMLELQEWEVTGRYPVEVRLDPTPAGGAMRPLRLRRSSIP